MTALRPQCCTVIALVAGLLATAPISAQQIKHGQRKQVMIRSSADGTEQPCFVIEPDKPVRNAEGAVPLLIALHSWSGDYQQRNQALEQACVDEGWYYIHPNFRGQNSTPAACGSELARQDILDALAWARKQYHGDPKRIYLTGVSGGGHMTMLMAARHPEHWTACSAWVGISDLAAWHAKHKGGRYGQMMRSACGGAPGDSAEVDREYHNRSPLPFLAAAKDLPLDIAAGVHDGHTGSVPIRQSLDAFNAIAKAREDKLITEDEIQQLSRKNGKLERPLPSDQVEDATFNREIHLRRRSGPARVTIFEGGHEGIAPAAIAWLKSHVRDPQKN
ncbi:MAG: prolyl oligopeptidase family serine peptidase [Planctomycetales bacterium]|nr:prolyl oligopeptidase family serine peptidase [Planctomycetales bacterium]